ncbi:MAG: hypothetical protein DDT40_01262 [candidate division WS2 bacterium]|nr:hypothetical protein [Bacillota bacterium]MBT9151078.1 hypothetical protein [Candidatus Psychracetigena formicireducens]
MNKDKDTDIKFFDVNVFLGRPTRSIYQPTVSGEDLIAVMDDLDIEKALVWHVAQYDYSAIEGNKFLSQAIANHSRLYGCWTVLPPQTKEMALSKDFFEDMKKDRIFALRVFPQRHNFLLNRVVMADVLDEITRLRIPLLLSIENGPGWSGIYDMLREFPDLVCVICDTGVWGTDRYFRPLLEKYSNVYVETSLLTLGECVLEKLVHDYGAERFMFGSAFPKRIPEAAMLSVLHADISDGDKKKIACSNLERLIVEIKL